MPHDHGDIISGHDNALCMMIDQYDGLRGDDIYTGVWLGEGSWRAFNAYGDDDDK